MWTVRATCQVAERNEPVSVQVNPDQTVGDAICEILEGIGLWASRLKGRFALGLVFRPTTGQSGTDVRLDKDKMLRDVVQEEALLEVTGDPGIIHDIESLPDQDLRICIDYAYRPGINQLLEAPFRVFILPYRKRGIYLA